MKQFILNILLGIVCLAWTIAPATAATPSFQVVVVAQGPGSVSPNVNGKLIQSGKTVTLTARPAAGALFAGWTGSLVSTSPSLRFTVRSNMVLEAHFIANPFAVTAGTYQGLFSPAAVASDRSGFISASPTAKGAYTGQLLLAGKTYSLSGQFSPAGWASNRVVVSKSNVVTVLMQLDLDQGSAISGIVSNGTWTADLMAYRSGLYAKTNAGKFTLLLPGSAPAGSRPGGDSYGAVTLSAAGSASLSGMLADGTSVSCSANVSSLGAWPVYKSLYSGKGLLYGWVFFANQADTDLQGQVLWIKPKQTGAKYYPAGFTHQAAVLGSRYAFTNKVAALDLNPSTVSFAAGNLPAGFTNQVVLKANNTITCTNKSLKLTLTTSSGLYQGNVANPYTNKSLKTLTFKGAVFQKQNFGAGFFLGTNQSGHVVLGDYPTQAEAPVVVVKGTTTTVTNTSLGSAGGTISINSGPLSGLSVHLPLGALPGTMQVRIARNDASLVPPPGSTVGQVFDLQAEQTKTFTEPVAITIPFTNDGSVVPVPYYIDDNGLLHPCQVTSVDNANGTLTFETFHTSLYTWLLARLPDNLRNALAAHSTSYQPAADGFQVLNTGSAYNRSGECFGMTTFEQWYFREKGGGFYPRYMQDIPLGTGNATIKGQAIIATRAFNSVARTWNSYVPRVLESYNLTPLQRYLSVLNILNATRVPTILYLARTGGAHSVLTYDYIGNTNGGVLLINDPNAPGAVRMLEYDPAHPDEFQYGNYDQVAVSGDGSFQMESFDDIYADAQRGFDGNGAAQISVISHTDGQQVASRTITLTGKITSGQVLVSQLSIVLNGSSVIDTTVNGNGDFSVQMSLNVGTNQLSFITKGYNGQNELKEVPNTQKRSFQLVADLNSAVILGTLTWNTATDVDFYTIDPTGDYSAYYDKVTGDGGELDYDNTSGYGPEHWTLNWTDTIRWNQPYKFRVHYYQGSPVTQWTVTILLYEGTPQMTTFTYSGVVSAADGSSNNRPNGSGPSWADVCTVVPVPAIPGAQPIVRKSVAGPIEITVPIPSEEERLVLKALHENGQQ